MKSELKLKGNKKGGWVIYVSDKYGYKDDIAITHEEMVLLKEIINSKIK